MPEQGHATAADKGFHLSAAALSAGERTIVQPLTFAFQPNRIYGLIGPNGSGKTTLLRMLTRHLKPTGGSIRYGGELLGGWSSRSFAREVAYVPQQLPTGQQLTVEELVALGRYAWHGPFRRMDAADQAVVDQAIAIADLAGLRNRLVDTLSGGERQRAWVAMMVAQAGHFLILDEPTSALDIAHQTHLLELLRSVAQQRQLGIIMSFHDINIAARFCDEVLAMKDGRMLASGAPDAIVQAGLLTELYGVPMATMAHPQSGRPIGFVR